MICKVKEGTETHGERHCGDKASSSRAGSVRVTLCVVSAVFLVHARRPLFLNRNPKQATEQPLDVDCSCGQFCSSGSQQVLFGIAPWAALVFY